MSYTAIIILAIYFFIGALALHQIGIRRTEEERVESWLKYKVYIVIVSMVLPVLFVSQKSAWFFHLGISWIGAYEIIRVSMHRIKLMAIGLLVFILIAVSFCLYAQIEGASKDVYWYIFFLVLVFDGFAQISGQFFGGRKLIAKVSPKKTISGFVGGWVMCSLTAFIICYETKLMEWKYALLVGTITSVLALSGDLLASLFKRKCGVKDYSDFIPGHGGFLDRFDSYIFVGAFIGAAYTLFQFMH